MIAPQGRSVQQLAEVLATLVVSSTEQAATQGAVERIAECFEAEVGAVLKDGVIIASVGFRRDGPLTPLLIDVANAGHGCGLEVPGAGRCHSVVVPVPAQPPRVLLLARSGEDGFSLEEASLLRSLAGILATAMETLQLRDRVADSDARFRRIVETANEGIWLLAVDGSTTFANDKIAEILGYTPAEMLCLSLFDVLDEAGKANAARNLERRRQGVSDQLECAFVRKDGSRAWVLLNASPLLDENGAYAGSLCMVSDISQRKRTEDLLSQREQQLAEAQRVAGLGSFEWDLVTLGASWSDGLYRILDLDPNEVEPDLARFIAHVHPDDRLAVQRRVQTAIARSEVREIDYRIIRDSGEIVWVQARSEVLSDDSGQPRLFRGTLLDVTESKLTEAALRETTARLGLLQAMATAANEASGLEGVLQVAVELICGHAGWPAGHAYLPAGWLSDHLVPLPIWYLENAESLGALSDVLPATQPTPALGLVGRVLAAGAPEWTRRPDEPRSDLERAAVALGLAGSFAFPVCVDGQVTCVLEFFTTEPVEPDAAFRETIGQLATQLSRVAERQRASSELATARDAAMESSRLKSDFLATMSHEIRTPMNGVIGLTGLLLDTELDERQRQYAEGVESAGESLLAIINDILDFSKIEAGRLELEVIEFELVQVVEEASGLVAHAAQRKGIELVSACAPDLPTRVRGDPARLRQVLLNLVSNAVKFTSEGEVVVRADLTVNSDGAPFVRFAVADTGIGVDAADEDRLFEPFSQADASTTRRFGGTGLGLAISRRLVAAMGGELGLHSVLGQGSTFWFTIPVDHQIGTAADESPLVLPPRGLRTLIVDDNTTAQETLRERILAWGLRCDVAADGLSALAVLKRGDSDDAQPYDVVLIDAAMPGMHGWELARRISSDPQLTRTRVVMMTSSANFGRTERGDVRISGCLTKPVRIAQLADALLPRKIASADGAPVSPSASVVPCATLGHVLVVEDNATNQMVAVGILRLLGYRADVASNGFEALEAMERADYVAILMDCQMPEMDGYAATREIRRRQGLAHTPVIAMTAGAGESDRDLCLAAGMDDFLSKPVKPKDVGATLARWVRPACLVPSADH